MIQAIPPLVPFNTPQPMRVPSDPCTTTTWPAFASYPYPENKQTYLFPPRPPH